MDEDRTPRQDSGTPRGWAPHPRERMLITPLVAGLGGLLAFFTVVFIVVWLPIHTFDPPPSEDWAPLSNAAVKGRNLFAENGSYQSPNLLGTERTGPDLSQESGWHPDDWQSAHFYDPRFVDPLSLMPPMKSLFSDTQIEQLITFVETRSGK